VPPAGGEIAIFVPAPAPQGPRDLSRICCRPFYGFSGPILGHFGPFFASFLLCKGFGLGGRQIWILLCQHMDGPLGPFLGPPGVSVSRDGGLVPAMAP
jgi:hypothetical protein